MTVSFRSLGLVASMYASLLLADAAAKEPLSVVDALETTRAMAGPPTIGRGTDGTVQATLSSPVMASPDGKRYAVMLVTGDLKRNGNWVRLLTGRLDSLDAAVDVRTIATLFTRALGAQHGVGGGSAELVLPTMNPPVWLPDNRRIAFFWEDDKAIRQVIAVDADTGRRSYLTQHETDVLDFVAGGNGVIIFSAKQKRSRALSEELLKRGFSVKNPDAFSVLNGDVDGYGRHDQMYNVDRFVRGDHAEVERKIDSGGGRLPLGTVFQPVLSDDGAQTVLEIAPKAMPPNWDKYTNETLKKFLQATRRGSKESARLISQLAVVDTRTGIAHPLWDAPAIPWNRSVRIAWSPDRKSVLVGPTFLPVHAADAAGLAGTAVAVVDVASGAFAQIAVSPEDLASGLKSVRWLSEERVELVPTRGDSMRFERRADRWEQTGSVAGEERRAARVRVEMREDLHTPPALFATDTLSGTERMVLDLNPQLRTRFSLGKVEAVRWKDQASHEWSGLLYYPVNYQPGRRYPLVIQTHGHAPTTEFSLYGKGAGPPGLGPGLGPYAAQPLANRGIAVLQMQDKSVPNVTLTAEEPKLYMRAYEAAIDHFVGEGLVDRGKIGLLGHSRSGWHVLYALTHSSFSYAAAIASDNMDGGYIQAALLSWKAEYAEIINGAAPFGEGLTQWLENSPALNAHRVNTPLQIQQSSAGLAGVMASWEMFSRLRALNKPVELYVVPDIEHASHTLQNPVQCVAAQQRAVDWWDYWLNGHEDPDPEKASQYADWRELRALHESNDSDQQRNLSSRDTATAGPGS